MTTADGKEITHASPQWHETWHYSPDETIGKSPTILNGEGSDIDASRALMRDLEKAGAAERRCTNTTKDGRARAAPSPPHRPRPAAPPPPLRFPRRPPFPATPRSGS